MSTFACTAKQHEILRCVLDILDTGHYADLYELQEVLSYKPSYEALQCSIRFLEKHGYVLREYEVRGSRKHVLVVPTTLAYALVR